jgi:NADH dehydrogenase
MLTLRARVVIIGGGFGGLLTARGLGKTQADVVLIDRRNHHLFQPLLYQVATGGLSPANIAAPLRALVKGQANTQVLLGDVTRIDVENNVVEMGEEKVGFDYLVLATGAGQSYFGNNQWAEVAPGLKSLEDATRIRRDVLLAFEEAEKETDPARQRALLTFVVVGAGPTGVELAGALAEISHRTLRGEFRNIDPTKAHVMLIEGADRVLPPFAPSLSAYTESALRDLGVHVRKRCKVVNIEPGLLEVQSLDRPNAPPERIEAANILWAAGVEASPLGRQLAEATGAKVDRAGRVIVERDCSLADRPEIFVIGDLAHFQHGVDAQPLPGLAPVAMQQGRHVAKVLRLRLGGDSRSALPFEYLDKGSMAVIGRRRAVAQVWKLRLSGLFAWFAWLFIHLLYLAEFQNRVLVMIQWGWNFVTRNRAARLITGDLAPRASKQTPAERVGAATKASGASLPG